jgi:hypothetical protein
VIVVEPGVDPGTFRFSDPNAAFALYRLVPARAAVSTFAQLRAYVTT